MMSKNTKITKQSAEQRINQIQLCYQEWQDLQPKLQQAQKDWQYSVELMQQMEQFYFKGEYLEYYEAIENGLKIDVKTQGEYSVMSEDTIWQAHHDHHQALWQQLRFAVKYLDKEHDSDE